GVRRRAPPGARGEAARVVALLVLSWTFSCESKCSVRERASQAVGDLTARGPPISLRGYKEVLKASPGGSTGSLTLSALSTNCALGAGRVDDRVGLRLDVFTLVYLTSI